MGGGAGGVDTQDFGEDAETDICVCHCWGGSGGGRVGLSRTSVCGELLEVEGWVDAGMEFEVVF